ncbi:MAG: LD-carboxypeptidase [Prevotella sp.]|nr:LD-carboxypeptidase [Prevotella sp.]
MKTRKSILIIVVLAFSLLGIQAQHTPVMPRPLKKGDRIAVISPSSSPTEKTVKEGCEILRQWGYVPVVGPHAMNEYHGFAGTADERAADLRWALTDSTISAIMCTRGGDGAVQLLTRISPSDFRRQPKWLIGFSDITALHSAMVQAGVMSIHGSMLHAISSQNGTDSVSVMLHNILEGTLPTYYLEHNALDQPGCAEGLLVGGNFSVLCGLAGSPYDCLLRREPLILFIEDTDEEMTKVDRMLHHLEVRGVLQRLKGIIVGHFTDYKRPKNDFEDMNEMLHSYLRELDIPVCYGFPVGHKRPNLPLIEGCRVRLNVSNAGTSLTFLMP